MAAFLYRAVHVGPKDQAVVHLDGHVPIDPHPVPDLARSAHRSLHPVASAHARNPIRAAPGGSPPPGDAGGAGPL